MEEAQKLLDKGRYEEAGKLLDSRLTKEQDDPELWYLRGLVSLKMKNYDGAQEFIGRALDLEKRAKYYSTKGMAHLEIFELDEAIEAFKQALELEQDATSNFFIAICYMFKDSPLAREYLGRAKSINSKKTKQLLKNFYTLFLKNDPTMTEAQKKRIEEKIEKLAVD
jgi:tetratricopeptide (TPR) repeat protein